MPPLDPRKQGRAEIEADKIVIVDELRGGAARLVDRTLEIGAVTFAEYPLIPIVIRGRARLGFDLLGPGVLAGRLVEMAVDADELILHARFVIRVFPLETATKP